MQISTGELQVWQAIGLVLEQEEPAEYELLPDIVETRAVTAPVIGRQPGAFDAGEIQLVAATLFGIAAPVVKAIWPKLFDAMLDIGKDALKKSLDRRAARSAAPAAAAPSSVPVSAQQVRAAIAKAAAVRQLSPRTAESLADALVAQFFGVADGQSGKAP